jgi:hypothetical protein
MAVAAFCLAGLLMPFFYQSGEEIRIDDRVNYCRCTQRALRVGVT